MMLISRGVAGLAPHAVELTVSAAAHAGGGAITHRVQRDDQALLAVLGADAIVALRMETSSIKGGASEIVAYGTAVRLDAAQ